MLIDYSLVIGFEFNAENFLPYVFARSCQIFACIYREVEIPELL